MASLQQNGKGLLLGATGFGLFSCGDVFVKILGQTYPSVQINFLTCLFAVAGLVLAAPLLGGLKNTLKTRRPYLHVLRGIFLGVETIIIFYAFSKLQMATVYTMVFTAPLFATLFAIPLFGERVNGHRWAALLIGFSGIIVATQPGTADFEPLALLVALGAAGFAVAMVITRLFPKNETPLSFALYPSICLMLVALVLTIPVWITPEPWHLLLFAICGLFGAGALVCLGLAFRMADSSVVSQFHYTQLVWGLVLGYAIFNDVPSMPLLAGAALIIASGLYLVCRENNVQPASSPCPLPAEEKV